MAAPTFGRCIPVVFKSLALIVNMVKISCPVVIVGVAVIAVVVV